MITYETMDAIAQAAIVCTGLPALFVMQFRSASVRRWGPVLGCLGQPFWWFTAYYHGQPGMMLLIAAYTVSWAFGFYNYWIRAESQMSAGEHG